MPLMTDPLAHLASLLEDIEAEIDHKRLERERLDAKLGVLGEYKHKIRIALEEERKKLSAKA